MTGPEFRELRLRLQLSYLQFGRLLGYTGKPRTVKDLMRVYEHTDGILPPAVQLRVEIMPGKEPS